MGNSLLPYNQTFAIICQSLHRFGNNVPILTILKQAKVFIHALEVGERGLCACFLSCDLYFVHTKGETGSSGYDLAMVMVTSMSESQAC